MNVDDSIPGAVLIGPWHANGEWRNFKGTRRNNATEPDDKPVHVDINGSQRRDGSIERHIVIDGDICLDLTAARALAHDVAAAADEMEALAG